MTPQQQFEQLEKAPNLSLETRKQRLKQLKKAIKANSNNIIQALGEDFGRRCETETKFAEIMICVDEINHTLKHIGNWVKPKNSLASFKFLFSKNAVAPQPLGVVGIISPWNYPFNLAIAPLIAAISAGNKVMVKPSEVTPKTSELIAKLLAEVFSPNEVAVSIGDLEVAQQFSALPFKHLLFTGSTAVGKIIMRTASKNLTPVTLELGGKSPVIIDDSYSLKTAAQSIVAGKFYNAGQTCIAPDYILINEKRQKGLIKAIEQEVQRSYPEILSNPDYTAIINQHHFDRLNTVATEALSKYQGIWPVGEQKERKKQIFPPLLVINPDASSPIMQNEIFGPILPIIATKDLNASLDYINSKPNPLTLYIFSNHKKTIRSILKKTLSGSVAVNETLVQFAQVGVAFGGVGESGMGSYHGKQGFDCFSHNKSIYYQSRINLNSMVRTPFTPLKKFIIKLMTS